ncbi:hypothetical protein ACIP1U_32215 [Cupriavidus sp. NPDC089707]|uniref:hypothetical protein n=1 Tax=Cupriavidus sp. NPDC089707 TaxID=3363963 RepID=UPI003809B72E
MQEFLVHAFEAVVPAWEGETILAAMNETGALTWPASGSIDENRARVAQQLSNQEWQSPAAEAGMPEQDADGIRQHFTALSELAGGSFRGSLPDPQHCLSRDPLDGFRQFGVLDLDPRALTQFCHAPVLRPRCCRTTECEPLQYCNCFVAGGRRAHYFARMDVNRVGC